MTEAQHAGLARNDPCPCGSGKKWKHCCQGKKDPLLHPGPKERAEILQVAVQALQAGQHALAERNYRRLLELRQSDAEAHCGLGILYGLRGDLPRGLEHLAKATQLAPNNALMRRQYATQLKAAGQPEAALLEIRRALSLDGSNGPAHRVAAKCYEVLGRLEEAAAELALLFAHDALDVEGNILQARVERRQGRLVEARERLENTLQRATLAERRATAWHELGEVLTAQGELERAFDAHVEAGRERARTQQAQRVQRVSWQAFAKSVCELPTALLGRDEHLPESRPRPVFLVGFPRSGTTVLEQVLAAHPRIATTDERRFLFLARQIYEKDLAPSVPLLERLQAVSGELRERMRNEYFAQVERALPGSLRKEVLVDQLPLNLVDLPWIRRIFPEARLLVALRDPRDVTLSCFMQDFAPNEAMVEFFTLAGAARLYADVMTIWLDLKQRIGLPWLELRYEETVADLEGTARKVLCFLGLEFDAAVLAFHERARTRALSTPSATTVIENVHGRAVGRWRAHAHRFGQSLAVLEPYIQAFGYTDKA